MHSSLFYYIERLKRYGRDKMRTRCKGYFTMLTGVDVIFRFKLKLTEMFQRQLSWFHSIRRFKRSSLCGICDTLSSATHPTALYGAGYAPTHVIKVRMKWSTFAVFAISYYPQHTLRRTRRRVRAEYGSMRIVEA